MTATVTDDGVWLDSPHPTPLVVTLDGRYVWSFTPLRDGRPEGSGLLVEWPSALTSYLHGRSAVRVADVDGGRAVFDDEVVLGTPADELARVRVEDRHGNPLAIDKVGHLCRAFDDTDEAIREEILHGTRRALDDLREHAGVEAYLNYGALLGAVRDGAMIAHDSDTDVCYLSRHASPADVILESFHVERVMRSRGWRCIRMSGGDVKLLLPLSDGRECHIDIFVAFYVGDTFFQLGNRSGTLPVSAILPVSTIELHGVEFPAPADPEAMLAFVYGPSWRVPDPSFKYADPPAGIRRLDGWLRGFRTQVGTWTDLHRRGPSAPTRRSDFAGWVHSQLPRHAPVVDLGCGTGRDALWYARTGRPVLAVDFARAARSVFQQRARRLDVEVPFEVVALGDLRAVLTLGADLARRPHHVHARQLVGALDEAERANLWRLCRMTGRTSFLELAIAGPGLPEPVGPARRVDLDALVAEIEAAGGVVEHQEVGPGTDLVGRPDPAVARLRLGWPRRGPSRRGSSRTTQSSTPRSKHRSDA
ncbi:class I SAM-dependent methyltransferase [Nocardioides sp. W7]|uniref:class I SAM-dependent methyltransferase n=1 Tax=Nocardioides sp. W7 TaxID=2931390 RepID=UPI001FD4F4D0|nr:class I SAM-dependent methyltransferase [Nocardioides sp. W7]